MHNNPYDTTFSSNLRHVDSNFHASANPSSYYEQKPMDNMMNSTNQYETPYVGYLTGYSQPVHTAPYLNTEPAIHATGDIHNSAYLQGDSRVSEDLTRAHMPDYNTMAYNTSPAQFQNLVHPWQEEVKSVTPSYN